MGRNSRHNLRSKKRSNLSSTTTEERFKECDEFLIFNDIVVTLEVKPEVRDMVKEKKTEEEEMCLDRQRSTEFELLITVKTMLRKA